MQLWPSKLDIASLRLISLRLRSPFSSYFSLFQYISKDFFVVHPISPIGLLGFKGASGGPRVPNGTSAYCFLFAVGLPRGRLHWSPSAPSFLVRLCAGPWPREPQRSRGDPTQTNFIKNVSNSSKVSSFRVETSTLVAAGLQGEALAVFELPLGPSVIGIPNTGSRPGALPGSKVRPWRPLSRPLAHP